MNIQGTLYNGSMTKSRLDSTVMSLSATRYNPVKIEFNRDAKIIPLFALSDTPVIWRDDFNDDRFHETRKTTYKDMIQCGLQNKNISKIMLYNSRISVYCQHGCIFNNASTVLYTIMTPNTAANAYMIQKENRLNKAIGSNSFQLPRGSFVGYNDRIRVATGEYHGLYSPVKQFAKQYGLEVHPVTFRNLVKNPLPVPKDFEEIAAQPEYLRNLVHEEIKKAKQII